MSQHPPGPSQSRPTIFGSEAEEYDRVRPGYPPGAVDLLVEGRPELLIDAGCGTGLAARSLVERGVSVLGVEPDERMAAVARRHGLDVAVSRLEDWEPVLADGMYAAQSWHWVDPECGARVAARSIRPGGRWTGLWNVEADDEVQELCDSVYRRLAPELLVERPARHLADRALYDRISEGFEGTRAFGPLQEVTVVWSDTVEVRRLVARLDSHSAHRLLPESLRAEVRSALAEALGDGQLEMSYRTEVLTTTHR